MSLVFPHSLYDQTDTANLPTGQPLVTLGHVRENAVPRSSSAKASELLSAPHDPSQVPVVDISQIQKYKTKEICSLPARPDFDFADLQMWLTLDAQSIQRESFVEDILHHQELHDNFLELVLESSTPFLVSVRYAGAFQKYASRKRSEDMRMADAADEKGAALEQLACAIAREDNFASLLTQSSSTFFGLLQSLFCACTCWSKRSEIFVILMQNSKFRDLKEDASIAKKLFYKEVTEALQLATYFQLKALVSEPLIAQLVRNQWDLNRGYKVSPACRFWFDKISYIVLCYLAWSLPPLQPDETEYSLYREAIAAVMLIGHCLSCLRQLNYLSLRRAQSLSTANLVLGEVVYTPPGYYMFQTLFSIKFWTEALFISMALSCVMVRYSLVQPVTGESDASSVDNSFDSWNDFYLFAMVLWWGRIGTILHVFRFSGRQMFNVFI
jgi:hypothetical protein